MIDSLSDYKQTRVFTSIYVGGASVEYQAKLYIRSQSQTLWTRYPTHVPNPKANMNVSETKCCTEL